MEQLTVLSIFQLLGLLNALICSNNLRPAINMGTKVLPKKIHRWSTAPEYCQMQNHEASTGHNLVLKRLFNNFPFFAKGIHAFCFFMSDNVELNFSYQTYQTIGPTAKINIQEFSREFLLFS